MVGSRPIIGGAERVDPRTQWLVEVAERRSEDAFDRLYQFYWPRLVAFLRNRGSDARISEEIAQEVMVSVWTKSPSFDAGKASASTWIYAIARNAHIDLVRKERRRAVDPDDPFFAPGDEPEYAMGAEDRTARLSAAICALAPEQAEILRLCTLGGMKHREAAAALGLPLTVVKYRARAAIDALRKVLEPKA